MPWGSPRMLVAFTLAGLATVGVVVVLVTSTWWALPIAMAGHLAAMVLVMRPIYRALGQQDKPDPLTEARYEAEGRAPTGEREEESAGRSKPSAPPTEDDEPRMAI